MSWLSSVGDWIGNAAKKVGNAVKTVATPLASFAAGLVPGVGPLLSKGVDIIGNKLLGESGDMTTEAGAQSVTPVSDLLATMNGSSTLQLGSSPVAQAVAAAVAPASKGFLGIGDGKPGVFGIGDGKPGVFGIGTGKGKTTAGTDEYKPGTGSGEYSPAAAKSGDASTGTDFGKWGLIGGGILVAIKLFL